MVFCYIAVILTTFGYVCQSASVPQKRAGPLTLLDDFNTKSLDKKVRERIMFMALQRANDTVQYQSKLKNQCETSINTTIDQCDACVRKSCGASAPQIHQEDIWQQLLPLILNPTLVTGALITGIEKTAINAYKFLGSEGGKFISTLGNVGKSAGEALLGGAHDLINDVGGKLSALGDKMANLASNIGSGLESAVNGIPNIASHVGSGLEHFGSQLTNGAQSALNGLSHGATDFGHQIQHGAESVGHSIESAANSVINGIKHIFGKRLDKCALGCQDCVKIDTKTHSSSQILDAVCGQNYAQQQQEIATEAKKIALLYSSALNHTIVQKVEYDPTSINTAHGVAFTTVYITVDIHGTPRRFKSQYEMQLTDVPTWSNNLADELYEM